MFFNFRFKKWHVELIFALNLFITVIIICLPVTIFVFRVPEEEFLKAFKNHPGLKTKINNFHRHIASANNPNEDFVAIRPEWTMVDRILACRFIFEKFYFPPPSFEK